MKKNLAVFSLVLLLPLFSCFSDEKKKDNSTSHTVEENQVVLDVNDEVTAAVDGAVEDAIAGIPVKKLHKIAMESVVKSIKERIVNKSVNSKVPSTGSYTFDDTIDGGVSGTAVITGSGSWTEDYTDGIPEDPSAAVIGTEYIDEGSYSEDLDISLTFDAFINAAESGAGNVGLYGGPLSYNSAYDASEKETIKVTSFTDADNFSYNDKYSSTETMNVTINGSITFYNGDYPGGIVVKYTDFKTTFRFTANYSEPVTCAGGVFSEVLITMREILTVNGSIAIGDNVMNYRDEEIYDDTFEMIGDKKK